MDHRLIRNAHVEVTPRMTPKGLIAHTIINNDIEYDFGHDSRVSKALTVMSPRDLSDRLTGGHYFFVEKDLVDFRAGNYNGFVQSDDSIANLIDVLGIERTSEFGRVSRTIKGNTLSSKYVLATKWSTDGLQVPGYAEGGDFNSQLLFTWNPFMKNVNTFFQLVRLICDNGMVGLATFLNRKIPLVNRWEEHLDIANRQIQNKVQAVAIKRLEQMGTERATVGELQQIHSHAASRHDRMLKSGQSALEIERLARILQITDPRRHLAGVYRSSVFEDKRMSDQMPAHLTTFDAYNIATELRSHTREFDKSTNLALDRFSNRIVFDRKNLIGVSSRVGLPAVSSFSDPNAAFFGVMH